MEGSTALHFTAELLAKYFADALHGEERVVERVAIERATDLEYMVRVWFVGEEDYEAYRLVFP